MIKDSNFSESMNQIVEYIQKSDIRDIIQCYHRDDWGKTLKPEWVPTIEPKSANNAFLTECATTIWTSAKAPVVDTLFTFVSSVCLTILKSFEFGFSFSKIQFRLKI